jgi:hypothetical protein
MFFQNETQQSDSTLQHYMFGKISLRNTTIIKIFITVSFTNSWVLGSKPGHLYVHQVLSLFAVALLINHSGVPVSVMQGVLELVLGVEPLMCTRPCFPLR